MKCSTYRSALALAAVILSSAPLSARTVAWERGRSLGDPVVYRNLTVVPVLGSTETRGSAYQTLDQAIRARTLSIHETAGGGTVNSVTVRNTGKRKVYLMAGEVILGGQQDRLIGQDAVVPPSKKGVQIPVYCVEHARWTGGAKFGQSASAVAAKGIRLSAQDGVAATVAAAPAHGRVMGAPDGMGVAQEQVWEQVARRNQAMKVEPSTGTYRKVVSLQAPGMGKRVGEYVKALNQVATARPGVEGVVVAVNGKIVSADVFEDASLFRALWPKLLRGYAAEAVEQYRPSAKLGAVTSVAVLAFLKEASNGSGHSRTLHAGGFTERVESGQSLTFSTSDASIVGTLPVHVNVLRKR